MALAGSAGLTDYCASKAAVHAFHESRTCAWQSDGLFESGRPLGALTAASWTVRLELQRDRVTHIRTLLACPSAVATGMFDGAFAGRGWRLQFARWLVPVLSEQEVTDCIVAAMTTGSSSQQLLVCSRGWRGWVLPWAPALVRLLPVALMDALVGLAGGHHGMSAFVGRSDGVMVEPKPKPSTE